MTTAPCTCLQNPCLQFPLETGFTQWRATQPVPSTELSILQPLLETLEGLTCNWMTLALAGTCGMGAIATTAFIHLGSVPPDPNCAALPLLASERDQLTCVQRAVALRPTESLPWAITWVRQWQPDHPLYGEGQQLLARWEQQRSQPQFKVMPQFSEAAADTNASPRPPLAANRLAPVAESPPATTPATLYTMAQTALQEQDWAGAFQALWQLQAWEQASGQGRLSVTLTQQIEAERQAQNQFNQALYAYLRGGEGNLEEALQRLQAIDPKTYVGRWVPLWVSLWQQADGSLPPQIPGSMTASPVVTSHPVAAQSVDALKPEDDHQPTFTMLFSEKLSGDRMGPK